MKFAQLSVFFQLLSTLCFLWTITLQYYHWCTFIQVRRCTSSSTNGCQRWWLSRKEGAERELIFVFYILVLYIFLRAGHIWPKPFGTTCYNDEMKWLMFRVPISFTVFWKMVSHCDSFGLQRTNLMTWKSWDEHKLHCWIIPFPIFHFSSMQLSRKVWSFAL